MNERERILTVQRNDFESRWKDSQARVRMLEVDNGIKQALIDDLGNYLAKLRKVVDAARSLMKSDRGHEEIECSNKIYDALRELDGETDT